MTSSHHIPIQYDKTNNDDSDLDNDDQGNSSSLVVFPWFSMSPSSSALSQQQQQQQQQSKLHFNDEDNSIDHHNNNGRGYPSLLSYRRTNNFFGPFSSQVQPSFNNNSDVDDNDEEDINNITMEDIKDDSTPSSRRGNNNGSNDNSDKDDDQLLSKSIPTNWFLCSSPMIHHHHPLLLSSSHYSPRGRFLVETSRRRGQPTTPTTTTSSIPSSTTMYNIPRPHRSRRRHEGTEDDDDDDDCDHSDDDDDDHEDDPLQQRRGPSIRKRRSQSLGDYPMKRQQQQLLQSQQVMYQRPLHRQEDGEQHQFVLLPPRTATRSHSSMDRPPSSLSLALALTDETQNAPLSTTTATTTMTSPSSPPSVSLQASQDVSSLIQQQRFSNSMPMSLNQSPFPEPTAPTTPIITGVTSYDTFAQPDDHTEDNTHQNDDDATMTLLPKSSTTTTTTNSTSSFWMSMLYGMINATIVIPVVMSFGTIIYQDVFFAPYTPVLIQLTMVSGIVHQLCFSAGSSIPFSVGSVQDAGLLFLASMATNMVQYCQDPSQAHYFFDNNYDEQEKNQIILATVTIGLGLATLLLGCGLILIGKFQWAGYVQRLPTCVVAGYLASIGWFCGKSGLKIMALIVVDDAESTTSSSSLLVRDDDGNQDHENHHDQEDLSLDLLVRHWYYVLPGIIGGIFIFWAVRTFRHVAVLPTCIVLLFLCFYTALWALSSTVDEATDYGWIRKSEPAPVWYHTWDYLRLDKVLWSVYPSLLLSELSMLFVVALSSSLDIAAIELELVENAKRRTEVSTTTTISNSNSNNDNNNPKQQTRILDYNEELIMVGWSNVISGATGGYTGSYIFSQSIFSLRSGITSRVAGFTLAACQGLILLLPIPVLSYVPNCFYGSLLGMICLDLVIEWLWDLRFKVSTIEYGIALSTFGLIQWLGVEYGILAGVGIYCLFQQIGLIPSSSLLESEEEDM